MCINTKKEVKYMPGGDRTGPWGAGPMTGRGAGYCAGYSVPGYSNTGYGYGRRRGRGFGRGRGRGWYGYPQPGYGQPVAPQVYPAVVQQQAPEQEIVNLENYQKDLVADKADLEKEMENVQNRIEELKKLKK